MTTPEDRAVIRKLIAPLVVEQMAWLALVAVTAIFWLGMAASPLTAAWHSWSVPPGYNPSANAPTNVPMPAPNGVALLVLAVVLLSAALAATWAILRARAVTQSSRVLLWFVLGAALVMGLTLVVLPALPSSDIFSYISYGRIGVIHHANALVATPAQFASDPFFANVAWQDTRSVYGPLWLIISDGVTWLAQALGGSLAIYVALYKLVSLGCHLASAALIWGILSRQAPQRRLLGTILYAWNPLALLEFTASGHNDALMLTLILLGLWLLARGMETPALLAWGASIATKYVFVVLLPLWLWHVALQLRADDGEATWSLWRRRIVAMAWRAGVVLAPVVVLLIPFWVGPETLRSVVASPTTQQLDNSLLDMLSWPLSWLVGSFGVADARVVVVNNLKLLGTVGFAAIWLWQLARRAPSDILGAWGWALLGYLTLASGWFWPWYVTWPLVIVALRPLDRLSVAVLLLASAVLTLYSFLPLESQPIYGLRSVVIFAPALGYLAWRWWHDRQSSVQLQDTMQIADS